MPLVLIQYKAGRQLNDLVGALALRMPVIVAPALSAAGDGNLIPNDVEVWCTESGQLDVNTKDIEIIIWAHEYPERRANLEERRDAIIKGVHAFLSDWDRNVSGFVWVLLQPTAFGVL